MDLPKTLGDLKASGYRVRSIKDEMRQNLIRKLRVAAAPLTPPSPPPGGEGRVRGVGKEPLFDGILGYEETVLPQVCNAILSRHDMLFLGLRGQAKTRMLRQLVRLLDDAMPIISGSEINDDPFHPISRYGKDQLAAHGDDMPIDWVGRDQRYHEKLATPDVTMADLIGEIDMIKHAEGRYLSSEATMHFGLIPRSNRGIFCMNELPDLSPKIQVGLFNVLEERDIQIRGYPVRLELDVCLVFSANPEDYTNRGRIVTPLKDRIGSVIRTHYPLSRAIGIAITDQNAWAEREGIKVLVPQFMKEVLEEAARLARTSPAINQQSGVSVRMSIANMENMISNAERRGLLLGEDPVVPRISDLAYLTASTRGKIELTMSEDEGQEDKVIDKLLGEAVKNVFESYFDSKHMRPLVEWFEAGKSFLAGDKMASKDYAARLPNVPLLKKEVDRFLAGPELASFAHLGAAENALTASVIELILEGLHVQNRLNKNPRDGQTLYKR